MIKTGHALVVLALVLVPSLANPQDRLTRLTRQAPAVQALTEVDTALSAVLVQRERVVALRDSYLPKARQARQTVEFAYRRGGASLLDFLDAQRTYRETALEHLRALGNFWSALYPLETVGGGARGRTSMSVQCAVLLLLALLSAACGDSSVPPLALPKPEAGTAAGPTDLTPKVVAPEYRTRLSVIETTGKVQFNEEALVRVQAPATGRVLEVFAQPGDIVEPGARLFVIDSADLGAAKSDYAKAVADAERSAAALKLTRELFEVQAVAQKELREAENDARKAAAERERAAARLRTLGVSPDHFGEMAARADATTTIVVTAPRSGVVVERNVAPGQVVAYGQSDTPVNLFLIADLGTMWVVADVYEPDVPRLRRGQSMVVTLRCCPGKRYEGTVSYISDMVDKETRTVKVRAIVVNRGRSLKAEMFVNVAIAAGTTPVLAIPQAAVHREGSQNFVLVTKGQDERERRSVRLGADLGDFVEVITGLTPDDRVVSTGSILLKGKTP